MQAVRMCATVQGGLKAIFHLWDDVLKVHEMYCYYTIL